METHSLSPLQTSTKIDLTQTYEGYLQARKNALRYQGGMSWRTVSGREYLVQRKTSRQTRSLGPRSEKTEATLLAFTEGKARAVTREKAIAGTLSEMAAAAKALHLNRMPSIVTAALRKFHDAGLLGNNLIVVGTHALYAYESAAGVFFDAADMATGDVDLLWDARTTLKIAASSDVQATGVLGLLKTVDKSFEPVNRGSFRAMNEAGFYVDLIKVPPSPSWKKGEQKSIDADDLVASEIDQLKWMVSSQKFSSTVIGQDGFPAPIVCPDPRAYALYKLWLSEQDSRDPLKKGRDYNQAIGVARLVQEFFPHLPFTMDELKSFPQLVADKGRAAFRFGL